MNEGWRSALNEYVLYGGDAITGTTLINVKAARKTNDIIIFIFLFFEIFTIKTIPFVLLKAQKEHEKGMVFSCICFGFRQRRRVYFIPLG